MPIVKSAKGYILNQNALARRWEICVALGKGETELTTHMGRTERDYPIGRVRTTPEDLGLGKDEEEALIWITGMAAGEPDHWRNPWGEKRPQLERTVM